MTSPLLDHAAANPDKGIIDQFAEFCETPAAALIKHDDLRFIMFLLIEVRKLQHRVTALESR